MFKGAPLFGLGIEVLESNNFLMGEGVLIGLPLGIQEVYPCGVGWIAIGNDGDLLVWFCGSQSFVHGDHSGLCSSVIRHVVGSDFQILSGDKKEDEVMPSQDFDVGFITCGDIIDRTFEVGRQ